MTVPFLVRNPQICHLSVDDLKIHPAQTFLSFSNSTLGLWFQTTCIHPVNTLFSHHTLNIY
jgi:hypothetical protein